MSPIPGSLGWEDLTLCRATKPMDHRAGALRTRDLQLLSPRAKTTEACTPETPRSSMREATATRSPALRQESSLCLLQLEKKPHSTTQTTKQQRPSTAKNKYIKLFKKEENSKGKWQWWGFSKQPWREDGPFWLMAVGGWSGVTSLSGNSLLIESHLNVTEDRITEHGSSPKHTVVHMHPYTHINT